MKRSSPLPGMVVGALVRYPAPGAVTDEEGLLTVTTPSDFV